MLLVPNLGGRVEEPGCSVSGSTINATGRGCRAWGDRYGMGHTHDIGKLAKIKKNIKISQKCVIGRGKILLCVIFLLFF